MSHRRKIAVIGLGYVGLPVAAAFARAGNPVVGFDVDLSRIRELKAGQDRTREVGASDLKLPSLSFSSEPVAFRDSDFFIVTVPTPIDAARRPDLGAMFEASRMVGSALKKGDIVVYESTVYPGAVEEECAPILEQASRLKAGSDFKVGYSPERINPGDKQHRFETIAKVVAGQDARTVDIAAAIAGLIVASPLFVIVPVAIKLDSRGPLLFRQTRHGYNNEPICVLKFRTMTVMEDGHHVGELQGFRFTADQTAGGEDAKAVRTAAQKALAAEFEARAERFGAGELPRCRAWSRRRQGSQRSRSPHKPRGLEGCRAHDVQS